MDELITKKPNQEIPKLTDEILKEIFNLEGSQQIFSEIETVRKIPSRVVVEGVMKCIAGDTYFLDCWGDEGGLKVEDIRLMFIWKDGDNKLKPEECLKFYNDVLVPLWNYFDKEHPRPLAVSCEDKIIVKKSELAMLVWLVVKCQSLDALNLGVYLTPLKKSKT